MSTTTAKDTLMETFERLFTCDEDVKKDFDIEPENREGDKATVVPVHSSVLTVRSKVFNTMINGESSFAEKKERKVKIPFSSQAVDMMVKYMYGFELEDCENHDAFLELIEIGGVYDIENLKKAAAEKIKPHVTKETVFHILSFAYLHKADDLKKICLDMIISTFSEKEVLKQKVIIDCPEMVVELWNLFENKKKDQNNRKTSSEDTMVNTHNHEIFFMTLKKNLTS